MESAEYYKTRLRAKGQVTLPSEVRQLLSVREGDDLVFRTNEKGQVVLERARIIPPDQAWFWTERWQRMEQEAQADIESGRMHRYANVEEAIADLEALEDAGDRTD
jgi:AbrB family looped-hinge helix DNA binding protein